ncbi:MAG: hypothetical protein KGS72_09745 [Cyanobacteria bacterium REEB67]|nr:hypothetical protein [Cyanobacteria bacterium REEB67]
MPAWLAGTWRLSRDGHFVLDPHRSADGKDSGIDPSAYVGFECGMIADKSGQVWTRDSVGKWSESADGRSYACYLKYDETTDADNKLRSHSETVAITTGDFAKITSCLRGVSDQVNRTIGDEEIEIIKTSHSYDWQGCGKTTSQWKATYKRVSPYDYEQKIDKYGDLSLAFVQFLKEQNMVERIPEALIIHQDGGVPQDSSVPLDTSAKAPLIDQ